MWTTIKTTNIRYGNYDEDKHQKENQFTWRASPSLQAGWLGNRRTANHMDNHQPKTTIRPIYLAPLLPCKLNGKEAEGQPTNMDNHRPKTTIRPIHLAPLLPCKLEAIAAA